MTTIIVNSVSSVTIDDVGGLNVADAMLNHRDDAAAIYDALVAYEATLRQATVDVQQLLNTANARITELETAATAAAATYQDGLAAAQASAAATVEQMRVSSQAQVDSTVANANAAIATAQAATVAAQAKQAMAESCEKAASALSGVLMAKGNSEAAVACFQEATRLVQTRERAELQAKLDAMPQD